MSLLDLLVLVIIGASVITGFLAGFARVGIGLLATILATLFGFWFYGFPAAWLHKWVSSTVACNLIGFFVIFFLILSLGALVGKAISKLFKWTGLSWLDRLMGGLFGFARGVLITVAFVAILLAFTPRPTPNWMVNSKVLPYAMSTSNAIAALAPHSIKDAFRESVAEIRKTWDEQLRHAKKELEPLKPESIKEKKSEAKKKEKTHAGRPADF